MQRTLLAVLMAVIGFPLMCCVGASTPLGCARSMDKQVTIVNADGKTVELSLWVKTKWIKLPFFDGDFHYIKCGDSFARLTDGGWVSRPSGLRLSPDRKTVYAFRTAEHSAWAELKIDLQTQEITRVNDVQNKLKLDGWELLLWHTRKEKMTAGQLVKVLNGPDAEASVAIDELVTRARETDDWMSYTSLLVDPRINPEPRLSLAINLSLSGKRYLGPAVLSSIAKGLNDPDPQTQLSAAALLSEYAANPPAKYVGFRRVTEPDFKAEHAKYVPLFQNWWVAGSSTTKPAVDRFP